MTASRSRFFGKGNWRPGVDNDESVMDELVGYDKEWVETCAAYPAFKRRKEAAMADQQLKDSGHRRVFASGAQRDRGELKPRPDLISPHANMREGMIFALGAEKYETRNWEKGMPISECLASAQRHIEQWKRGDTDEDHMAQARWNLGAIIHFEEEIKAGRLDRALDDMPKYAQQLPGAVIAEDVRNTPAPMSIVDMRALPRTMKFPTQPRVYIAGPMRGLPEYNFPAFDEARDRWNKWGCTVINPADLDREAGFDPTLPNAPEWDGDKKEVIERDIKAILDNLRPGTEDAIVLLPGWENSVGAAVEVALGKFLGLNFACAETGLCMEV